jgi:DNA mismatch repair protein MutL
MSINLLPPEIINQIAAGEIIENPASVIKELVENSIDAKAKRIEIILKKSGFEKIIVKDDGIGISKEDLILAPKRHATSKIKSFEDLYSIKSFGFRGEALASIFSVSKAKIISKQKGDKIGNLISYEDISKTEEIQTDFGTIIEVKDLFYNTPVRKKYLKSEKKELKDILDIVEKISLANSNIFIQVKNDDKLIFNKPFFNNLEDNIIYILGKDLKGNLLKVENEFKGIKIYGFIGNPSEISYPVKKNQYIFVNSRFIKSKLVSDAIYEGFSTNLMEGRHPFFVIFIDIDPEIIDVNIHPKKIEIKFENEIEIFSNVKNSIYNVFLKNETFKSFEKKEKYDNQKELNEHTEIKISKNNSNNINKDKNYFSKDFQKELKIDSENNLRKSTINYDSKEIFENNNLNQDINNLNVVDNFKENFIQKENNKYINNLNENSNLFENKEVYGPLYDTLKEYKIIGQVNKTFIILETPKEMIIIDQHVAEEKFFFEKLKYGLDKNNLGSQYLLKSEILELTPKEMLIFEDNKDIFKKIGFEIEKFGENEIIVRKVPILIKNEILNPKIIKDIIYEISIDKKFKLLEEKHIDKLASISCKSSIKAGDELTISEIKIIVENLKKLKEPFNCPHGRPILLKWDFKDLEKKFKRIL